MNQFIVTLPAIDAIPAFLDSLAESDEYSEFIDNHRTVLIGFLDMVFDRLSFSGQEVLPSEENQCCAGFTEADEKVIALGEPYELAETRPNAAQMIDYYRYRFNDTVADAYDTERALERIKS